MLYKKQSAKKIGKMEKMKWWSVLKVRRNHKNHRPFPVSLDVILIKAKFTDFVQVFMTAKVLKSRANSLFGQLSGMV